MNIIFLILFFATLHHSGSAVASAQQFISVIPTGSVKLGTNIPNIPITTTTGQQILVQQPPLYQIVRQQPTGFTGLGQIVGQSGSLAQLLASQNQVTQVLSNGGLTSNPAISPFIVSNNGMGLASTTTTVPYPYAFDGFTTTNINGVPYLVTNGGQSVLEEFQTSPVQTTFIKPFTSVNPVIRQAPEEVDVISGVPIDPLDAALLDMENSGQMHMEKYAWGRSAPLTGTPKESTLVSSTRTTLPKEQVRSDVPLYYFPNKGVNTNVSPYPRVKPSSPLLDHTGKRRKHFEFYQYFRNLGMNPSNAYVPVYGDQLIPQVEVTSSVAEEKQ